MMGEQSEKFAVCPSPPLRAAARVPTDRPTARPPVSFISPSIQRHLSDARAAELAAAAPQPVAAGGSCDAWMNPPVEHFVSPKCWCHPTVGRDEYGTVIAHHEPRWNHR